MRQDERAWRACIGAPSNPLSLMLSYKSVSKHHFASDSRSLFPYSASVPEITKSRFTAENSDFAQSANLSGSASTFIPLYLG